ncbi:NitT/TauT family transport system permease protein [Azospirillum agricola]|uniref:ABC transporter permease n=1 Tax=Azospirillum agricola TaxID=1720247 RepID=UPI001F188851|nr:ABC transporter permease subunit [Azospirillum agricola]MBP2229228.1 NitT/TauT family transport system permease protein [Azospirillum agricola]
MSDATDMGIAVPAPAEGLWRIGILAASAWAVSAAVTLGWPDLYRWESTAWLGWGEAAVAALLLAAALGGGRPPPFWRLPARLRRAGPWLVALGLVFALWEAAVAKFGWLPRPFFAPPQALLDAYIDDGDRLLECILHSGRLLLSGISVGFAAGFAVGVAIGWSQLAAYWIHPVLRLIGPVPATAWLPITLFVFPTTFEAGVFLIALSSGVPVAVLTWSGVASVNSSYYDIARTLGASNRFLVLKVAVPAAMPHVFVGAFMGLTYAFVVLIVAEMLGVKAGLGWYLQWSQGWAAYGNMYAALLIMAVLCSGMIALLFRARDRLLAWQKGLLRW